MQGHGIPADHDELDVLFEESGDHVHEVGIQGPHQGFSGLSEHGIS